MTVWLIEPRDPLIVRDGRPFGPDPGARATSLPFPFPSTTTGGVRTRAGLNEQGFFDLSKAQIKELKRLGVRGPLLVQLTRDGNGIELEKWLVPAPRDALFFPPDPATQEPAAFIRRLVPLQLSGEIKPTSDQGPSLFVGQLDYNELRKPSENAPHFWFWDFFLKWLVNPSIYDGENIALSTIGMPGLSTEHRMHVSIEADKQTAKDGMLFQTSGLEFTAPGKGEHRLSSAQRLALAVAADDDAGDQKKGFKLHPGLAGFGGERRIVTWRKSSMNLPPCPIELEDAIVTQKACRVFLLTPACFTKGYRPIWLFERAAMYGVAAKLEAITVQRPQVVSGWDLALKKPKPSCRLAPAGTVLFLSLKAEIDDAIRNWIRHTWMHCISDDSDESNRPDGYRLDGYGLAVLGIWNGKAVATQREEQS